MYNRVVVPLDGSKLAELALPHLEVIAKGCSIPRIMLVSVTEKIKAQLPQGQAFEKYVPERPEVVSLPTFSTAQMSIVFDTHLSGPQDVPVTLGKMAKTAADYLCKVAKDLAKKGFDVVATVLMGNPAEQIANYVAEQPADLVIMASTGKSGISKWNMSNISAKVIKETCVPVLLIRPGPDFKETKPRRKGVAL